ncbi:probable protein phosphatase 2C 72 [Juglans microcarpa x Juglans regia]|uniref:probable protein phosphatase 2C 72 n=1 Tax=Juglans microcarpa x Juglans regia TaxID=2249226 RepID=UPI001B7E74EE|nr:probable protein phosphatase 2C 72 [Juglans microcarpa x Juglans regia]
MGICRSVESREIHDAEDCNENVIFFQGNKVSNEALVLCSLYSKQGSKGLNQDSAILHQGYGVEDGALCGVFDGHGKNGHVVSKLVCNHLPSLLLTQKSSLSKINAAVADDDSLQNHMEGIDDESIPSKSFHIWKKACISAFKVMDKEIKLQENLDCSCSGTTAVVAIRQGEDLVIANLGDSRAILGMMTENGVTAFQLTTDLKPGIPCEAERIKNCHGRVAALKQEPHIQRVWLPHEDTPGLAMSRAFGDFVLKDHGIIVIPNVYYHRLTSNDQFIILATDGVRGYLNVEQPVFTCSSVHSPFSELLGSRTPRITCFFPF